MPCEPARRSSPRLALALTLVLGLGAACDDDKEPSRLRSGSTNSTPAGRCTGNLTVLAAASLSESFKELGTAFEGLHPGTKVNFSFDSSSALATQANGGAPGRPVRLGRPGAT